MMMSMSADRQLQFVGCQFSRRTPRTLWCACGGLEIPDGLTHILLVNRADVATHFLQLRNGACFFRFLPLLLLLRLLNLLVRRHKLLIATAIVRGSLIASSASRRCMSIEKSRRILLCSRFSTHCVPYASRAHRALLLLRFIRQIHSYQC